MTAPDADFVPDAEMTAMAPDGVSIHATRVHLSSAVPLSGDEPIDLAALRAYVTRPLLDEAAGLLAAGPRVGDRVRVHEHRLPRRRGRRRHVESAS